MRSLEILFPLLLALAGCSSSQPDAEHWQYAGGPFAQNVTAVLVDEKLPGTVYAGLSNGDVYVSRDNGSTWSRSGEVRGRATINCFAQDSDTPDRIYAATSSGLAVSVDRGKNWNPVRLPLTGGCRTIAIDPWNTSVVYAGTMKKGILKTTNAGATWQVLGDSVSADFLSRGVYTIVVDMSKPDLVAAAIEGVGIVRTTNAGTTWSRVTDEFASGGSDITHIVLGPAASGTIVYSTSSGNILKSVNDGQSWSPTRYGQEADAIYSLLIDPAHPSTIYAGTSTGILTSTDFGTTWTTNRDNLPDLPTSLSVAARGGNNTMFAFGPGIGVQRSSDGGMTWAHADLKLGGSTVKFVLSDRTGAHVFASVGATLMRYRELTNEWEPAGVGILGNEVTCFAYDSEVPTTMYAVTSAGLFKTTNGGELWKPGSRTLQVTPTFIETHPNYRTRIFASGEQGLFLSTDRGETWMQTRPFDKKFRVRSLSFQSANAGLMYGVVEGGGTISTENGGFLWEKGRSGLTGQELSAVTLDDQDMKTLYAWTVAGDGFRSVNKGLDWNRYAPPWRALDTVKICFDRYQPSTAVALVNGRDVYYSRSGGGTWFLLGEYPLPAEVASIHWNGATSTLYAGTVDEGIFRISLDGVLKQRFGD